MLTQVKSILEVKKSLAGDVYFFRFRLISPESMNFEAGQYIFFRIEGKTRIYSIASPPYEKNKIELVVKILPNGLASSFLKSLKENEKVEFFGPAGMFTLKDEDMPMVFMATGTGIAPIRSMLKYLSQKKKKQKIYLFWGLRERKDIYFFEEFWELNLSLPNLNFYLCLSRETDLQEVSDKMKKHIILGRVDKGWERFFKKEDFKNFDHYLCGSRHIVESLREFLQKRGVTKIFFERF